MLSEKSSLISSLCNFTRFSYFSYINSVLSLLLMVVSSSLRLLTHFVRVSLIIIITLKSLICLLSSWVIIQSYWKFLSYDHITLTFTERLTLWSLTYHTALVTVSLPQDLSLFMNCQLFLSFCYLMLISLLEYCCLVY